MIIGYHMQHSSGKRYRFFRLRHPRVARQYNGRLGKVDNCQVGVFGALSDGTNVGLIDARLYPPQEWWNMQVKTDTR